MLNHHCPVQTLIGPLQFDRCHDLLYHDSSIGFLVAIDHFSLWCSGRSIRWWSPCNAGLLHKRPYPYLSIKNAFASSVVSRSGYCTQENYLDQMIFILSVSLRHLIPWNTVHPQGLFRNEESLFIHMNTVVKVWKWWSLTWFNFVTAKSTRWTLCTSVRKGYKEIVCGIISPSFGSLLILNTEDFGISNANAIDLIVLLWLRGRSETASRTSSRIQCWGRPEFPFFFGKGIELIMSGFLKFTSARCQIFLIVFNPHGMFQTCILSRPASISIPHHQEQPSRAWTMFVYCCEVRFGFLIPSWRGATVVSSSEAGAMTSYLLRIEGTSPFLLQD